ncbi:MAG TPA: crosslink repair DNA glycosylase YcaQ family protein [Candidatus Thermoplasmatota archaeon]|nr:crosslink repair DNA glycosylase YcaQ family protein [Candidatus Thermoplasmatota archaeon]
MQSVTRRDATKFVAAEQGFGKPLPDVVSALERAVGLYAAAPSISLALMARVRGFTQAMLEDALYTDKTAARITAMRGVVYAVPKGLVPTAFQGSRATLEAAVAGLLKQLDATEAELDKIAGFVGGLLASAPPLTVNEIRGFVPPGLPQEENLGHMLSALCARGYLVRATTKGGWRDNLHAYQRLAHWLPGIEISATPPDKARADLARRYFEAYGPASLQDFAWWSGLKGPEAQVAFDAVREELVEIGIQGMQGTFFLTKRKSRHLLGVQPPQPSTATLLPYWDAYMHAYWDRSRYVDRASAPYVYDKSGNGTNVVVVDGQVVAIWDFEESRRRVNFRFATFANAPANLERMLQPAVNRLNEFFAVPEVQIERYPLPKPLVEEPAGAFQSPLKRRRTSSIEAEQAEAKKDDPAA